MATSLPEQIDFINKEILFHNSQSRRKAGNGNNSSHSAKHLKAVSELESVLASLKEFAKKQLEADKNNKSEDLFTISPSELADLPPELQDVLKLNESELLNARVVELLEIAARPLSIAELIIGMYRKYDFPITDRNSFGAKLYRMKEANLIEPVPSKKGVYRLPRTKTILEDIADTYQKSL